MNVIQRLTYIVPAVIYLYYWYKYENSNLTGNIYRSARYGRIQESTTPTFIFWTSRIIVFFALGAIATGVFE